MAALALLLRRSLAPSLIFNRTSLSSVRSAGTLEGGDDMEVPAGAGAPSESISLPIVTTPSLSGAEHISVMPCFRVLNSDGSALADEEAGPALLSSHGLDEEFSARLQTAMVRLSVMDSIFYESQRQGSISFYMVSTGEEAVSVGSAAGLDDSDLLFTQYREQGALLWRDFTFNQFADQCYGNTRDLGKGRQMPVHYGDASKNFVTISSPLSTQIPQAVGAAYGMKVANEQRCAVTYFGDGAASEGDTHAALNFASTLQVPVIFVCRNNGWAISTPAREQYGGFGIAERGPAYGIHTIRVDGNDVLAVVIAMREARKFAIENQRPVLVETMSYRGSHHSTSDDSSKYRSTDEVQKWKAREPITRHRKWMIQNGWWTEERDRKIQDQARVDAINALDEAAKAAKPPLSEMFTDVYDVPTKKLLEQEKEVREFVRKDPQSYPSDVPV